MCMNVNPSLMKYIVLFKWSLEASNFGYATCKETENPTNKTILS